MEDLGPLVWTLAEHLAAGTIAIAQIAADHDHVASEPVCHHLFEVSPSDPSKVNMSETYNPLVPLFAAAGVDFVPFSLEAWETVRPDSDWLHTRIPAVFEAARVAGLIYDGWTWEPRNRKPIGACTIQVTNNRTA